MSGTNNGEGQPHVDPTDSTSAALLEQLIYVDSFMPESDPTAFDNQLTAELAAFADDLFIFPDEDKPKGLGNDDYDIFGRNDTTPLNGNANGNSNSNSNSNSNDVKNGANNLNNVNIHGAEGGHDRFDHNGFTGMGQPTPQQPQQPHGQVPPASNTQINPDLLSQSLVTILSSQQNSHNSVIDSLSTSLLASVPKIQVPPGAMATLSNAGLSQIQIDALAALIAQHQAKTGSSSGSLDFASGGVTNNNTPRPASANDNVNFHDSAMSTLNLLTSNMNVINNFTPVQTQNTNQTQLSNLVSILNANSPRPLPQQVQLERIQQVDHQLQSSPAATTTAPPSISSNNNVASSSSIPSQITLPSPSSSTSSTIIKQEPVASSTSLASPDDDVNNDKRRRNTAASARFRIKKKLKEQEMQRNIRELNENSHKLQMRIQQLEMENRLLRNLVIEKGAQRNNDELEKLKQRAREGI